MKLQERALDRRPIGIDEQVNDAVVRGVECLLSIQRSEGYWLGELGADTTLESDYIFYLSVLGRTDRIGKLANRVRARQLPDGGWNIYQGGPAELNASVKAYFALKLAGDAAGAVHMVRARQRVLGLGGLERTNSFVRFYLALAGVIGWDIVPGHPTGVAADTSLASAEHLRDVRLDACDRHPPDDSVHAQARVAGAGARADRRAVLRCRAIGRGLRA